VTERGRNLKVAGLIVVAMLALLLVTLFGTPALTNYLAPFVPLQAERSLGAAMNADIRELLDDEYHEHYEGYDDEGGGGDSFECGTGSDEAPGRAALARLLATLEKAAALALPLDITVVRNHDEVNAFALPGGHIYVLEGMIDEVESVDELAGVLGHEMGHVAHRDGMRAVLQAYGLTYLFSMLPPELLRTRDLLQFSYSRERELAADRYSVGLLEKAGADPRAAGTLLLRAGDPIPGMEILSDHPNTDVRMKAIEALAHPPASPVRLLERAEWDALKRICAG
jgi:Zn-dependent protease with chaperone function